MNPQQLATVARVYYGFTETEAKTLLDEKHVNVSGSRLESLYKDLKQGLAKIRPRMRNRDLFSATKFVSELEEMQELIFSSDTAKKRLPESKLVFKQALKLAEKLKNEKVIDGVLKQEHITAFEAFFSTLNFPSSNNSTTKVEIVHVDQITSKVYDVVIYTGVVRPKFREPVPLIRSVYKAMTRAREGFIYLTHQNLPNRAYHNNALTFTENSKSARFQHDLVSFSGSALSDLITLTTDLSTQKNFTAYTSFMDQAFLMTSFHHIYDFISCPMEYYYKHVIGLPTISHEALLEGIKLHKLASNPKAEITEPRKRFPARLRIPDSPETSKQIFLDSFSFALPPPSSGGPPPGNFPKEFREVKLGFYADNVLIMGEIDKLVIGQNGEVVISEHKTKLTAANVAMVGMQLFMYLTLFEKRFQYPVSTLIGNRTTKEEDESHPVRVGEFRNLLYKPRESFETSQQVSHFLAPVLSLMKRRYFVATPSRSTCSLCEFKDRCPVSMSK